MKEQIDWVSARGGPACLPAGRPWAGNSQHPDQLKLFSKSEATGCSFAPPSAELEAVFRKAKCAAIEDVALAPALPCAGNDKELSNFV